MAEVLGIVASVAALIQLANYGEKFAKALLKFSKQNSSPLKKVIRCASQAQDFSDCIDMTQFALDRHFMKYTNSSLLQYLSSQGILNGILNRSKSIKLRLEKATRRVRSLLGGGNAVVNFFKWWYQKDSILDLFPEMDSVKISLQLLVSATQLEVLDLDCHDSLFESKRLNTNEKQIKRLKRAIRRNLKTLKRLEAQNGGEDQSPGLFAYRTLSTSSLYELLLPLGRSMVKNGSVPEPESVSATSSESSARTRETYRTLSSEKSMPSVSSVPSPGADSQTEAWHHDHEAQYKLERRLQQERLSHSRSSSAKSTASSPSSPLATIRIVEHGSGASSNMREARSVPASQLQRQQSKMLPKRVFVVDTANFDKLDARSQVLENGQLSGKIVTGRVNTTLEVSIMSIIEAERLGLNVISCEEDKETEFKFDQGKCQPCIGMVTLAIYNNRTAGSQSRTTRHEIHVLEDCHPRLIFGKDIWDTEEASKQ